MTATDATDLVRVEVSVPLGADAAFTLLTDGMPGWWPATPRLTPDGEAEVRVEPADGGAWAEHGTDGRVRPWGRVLAWDPPLGLTLAWAVGADRRPEPDPDRASTVLVRVAPVEDDLTTVIVEHRDLGRHGPGAGEVRRWVTGDEGWWAILRAYAAAARGQSASGGGQSASGGGQSASRRAQSA